MVIFTGKEGITKKGIAKTKDTVIEIMHRVRKTEGNKRGKENISRTWAAKCPKLINFLTPLLRYKSKINFARQQSVFPPPSKTGKRGCI